MRPPQTAAIGDRLSLLSRGTREHPYGKAGRDWDRLPESPDCTSFFFWVFFFLKSLHLFSFCPRTPAGVFIPAGCWVIYLLALLSPLAGVFQVGSLNSSEPRARGGARWVVLISDTLPKKKKGLISPPSCRRLCTERRRCPGTWGCCGRIRRGWCGSGRSRPELSFLGRSSQHRRQCPVRGLGVPWCPPVSLGVPQCPSLGTKATQCSGRLQLQYLAPASPKPWRASQYPKCVCGASQHPKQE